MWVKRYAPMVTALIFPLMIIVEFLQPKRFTIWLISALSTVSAASFSWYSWDRLRSKPVHYRMGMKTRTIAHLFPSSANLEGFFPISAWGFAGLAGFFGADNKTMRISNHVQ
jgi:hypothetical protein